MDDRTMTFSIGDQTEQQIRSILITVYDALKQKGYNPINQIVGYILSEDPTYITTHNNARNLIRRIDRDTLLQSLVKYYLSNWKQKIKGRHFSVSTLFINATHPLRVRIFFDI